MNKEGFDLPNQFIEDAMNLWEDAVDVDMGACFGGNKKPKMNYITSKAEHIKEMCKKYLLDYSDFTNQGASHEK